MTATVPMQNLLALAQLITDTENNSLIYWQRGIAAKHIFGADLVANDCWAATTMLEHYISLLPPDQTTWTTEENNVLTQLKANATAAQTKVDAIIGVSSQETTRVNANLATAVAAVLASL
jgi:hypothetical protein